MLFLYPYLNNQPQCQQLSHPKQIELSNDVNRQE